MYDDANRPTRARLPRPDAPREYGSAGTLRQNGYETVVRKPRLAGYPDLVDPERADRIDSFARDMNDNLDY